jgi:integrase
VATVKTKTFEECAIQFFNAHSGRWQNRKYRSQFLSALRAYAFPIIGKLPVSAVDTGLIIQILDPIWNEKTTTANRLRGWIEQILGWATVRGLREGDNPARWRGHLGTHFAPKDKIARVQHHEAMAYRELPAFLAELRKRDGVAAKALEFTILTAARTGEVLGAKWSEFDLESGVWTVPPGRGREHRVPLAKPVIDLLNSLPAHAGDSGDGFTFIGPRPGSGLSHVALFKVMKRLGRRETTHGFRSTFRTWASERTAIPDIVAEMALAHQVGSAVEKAYQRSDLFEKRRKLMDAWAAYCVASPASGAKVVVMRGAAS